MPSHNCGKNLHSCQWERDIFLFLALLFLVLNLAQLAFVNRAKLYRCLRRGADRIPEAPEDREPIISIND